MESILTDIIKESKIITGLKSVFMDFLDVLIVLFIFLWIISFLHKNFIINNKLLSRWISKIYHRRNYIYLLMFSLTSLLIFFDRSGVRDYIITYNENLYIPFLCAISTVIDIIFKKVFLPKEDKQSIAS